MVRTQLFGFNVKIKPAFLSAVAIWSYLAGPAAAHAGAAMCESAFTAKDVFLSAERGLLKNAIIPPFQKPPSVSPQWFMSKWRNRWQLWLHRNDLIEISEVPVRHQCFGSCYLYASQTVVQTALRAAGAISSNDYLINLVPLIEIGHQRYHSMDGLDANLQSIVTGGLAPDALASVLRGTAYVLNEASLKKIGGPREIAIAERRVLSAVTHSSLRSYTPEEKVKAIFDNDIHKIINGTVLLLEKELSRIARSPIKLKALPIAGIDLETVSASGFHESDFSFVLSRVLRSLAEEKAVYLGVRGLFGLRGEAPRNHALAIVGAVINRKTRELKGFKFLNSFGPEDMAGGFGYISRDQVEANFNSLAIVNSIRIGDATRIHR